VIQFSHLHCFYLFCHPYYFGIFVTTFLVFLPFFILLGTNWAYRRALNLPLLSLAFLSIPAEGSLASA
jgi:hypothetical protein